MLTSRVSGCKDSANRMKYQIYLGISEVQPIFCVREAVTKISGNRTKFTKASAVVTYAHSRRWDKKMKLFCSPLGLASLSSFSIGRAYASMALRSLMRQLLYL